jgi:hypothetical protein
MRKTATKSTLPSISRAPPKSLTPSNHFTRSSQFTPSNHFTRSSRFALSPTFNIFSTFSIFPTAATSQGSNDEISESSIGVVVGAVFGMLAVVVIVVVIVFCFMKRSRAELNPNEVHLEEGEDSFGDAATYFTDTVITRQDSISNEGMPYPIDSVTRESSDGFRNPLGMSLLSIT